MTPPDAEPENEPENEDERPPSLDDAAEELYGLDRDAFIPRRDAMARRVRAAGDRDTAGEIAALRKPSVAAWVANQLAREHPDEVAALEDLGASLAQAQERLEGDALRRLSRQRHELVNALVERGRRIAREEGVRFADGAVRELERTVTAALSDPGAARVLAAGRLTSPLEPGAGLGAETPVPPHGTRPRRVRPDRRPSRPKPGSTASEPEEPQDDEETRAQREAAHEAAQQARAEADRLAAEAEQAERDAESAEQARVTAAGAASDLRGQLAELRERLAGAEDDERRTADSARAATETQSARRREADDADDAARRAEREAEELG